MGLSLAPLTRDELKVALPALVRRRVAVFRNWPYRLDGDMDYAAEYLAVYGESPDAIVVGASDGGRLAHLELAHVETVALSF